MKCESDQLRIWTRNFWGGYELHMMRLVEEFSSQVPTSAWQIDDYKAFDRFPETQSPPKNVGPANLPHCCSSGRHVTVT